MSLPTTDANYPYRGQIKVIYNGTTAGTPAGIISNSPLSIGVPQLVNNAGNNLNSATNPTNLAGIADNTDTPPTADIGQGIGDSQNALISSGCYCYKQPILNAGTTNPTKHGITALKRANSGNADWPIARQSAWTVLEAKTKGFVVNRVAFEDADSLPATPTTPIGIPTANYVIGMMVYDTIGNCLKIYNGTTWNCYTTPACPD